MINRLYMPEQEGRIVYLTDGFGKPADACGSTE